MSGRSIAASLIRDTGHAASGRIASVLLWVVLTPAILRRLGPETFALWAIFLGLAGYLTGLDLGLAQGTLRHVSAARVSGDHRRAGAHASLAMLGYLALGVAWIGIVALASGPVASWLGIHPPLLDAGRFALIGAALVFTASGVTNVVLAALQGLGRFDLANTALLSVVLAQGGGCAVVLARGGGLRSLILVVLAGWIVGTLVGIAQLRGVAFHWVSPRGAWQHVRDAARFGVPMQIATLCAGAHQQLDKFLLARMLALVAVTPYELGFRVASAAATLPQQLLLAVVPTAARLEARGEHTLLRRLHDDGQRYLMAFTAVWLAALAGGAPRLVAAWLGPGHDTAAEVARGLAVAWALALASGMGTSIARGLGRTGLEARFAAVVLVVHLAGSLVAIPILGVRGALLASVLANAIGTAVFLVLLARALDWPLRAVLIAPFGMPVLSAAVGALAGALLDRALPLAHGMAAWGCAALVAVAGALAAALVLLVSGRMRGDDLARVRAALGARGRPAP